MELRLALNAGSMQESDAQQGLAHFCEHMCFNGTENFAKHELIDYLESVGVRFGAHLNAYTSFDETVYMLQLPTDDGEVVDKGFQILKDWAHNVSFDADEIDKERGVVIEEWRLGQGASERMRKEWWPLSFKDSRYAERLPIGKVEVLRNFNHETLKQFYADWYRPDLMAVIAVGDFDVDEIEQKVKAHFSKLTNPENGKPREDYSVPDRLNTEVIVLTDPEASTTNVQISYLQPPMEVNTIASYKKLLKIELFNMMLNERLAEYSSQGDLAFSYGFSFYGSMVRTKNAFSSIAYLSADQTRRAITVLLEENKRVLQYGFTPTEFERAKRKYISNLNKRYAERDKTPSRRLTWEYVQYFLEGSPAPGVAFKKENDEEWIAAIDVAELNELAIGWMQEKRPFILITAPEKDRELLPEEAEVLEIYERIATEEISPYLDRFKDEPLISKLPEAGTVINESKGPYETIQWELSNGAKVIFKKTDFKNDEIRMRAFSHGGYGLCSEEDLWSARTMTGPVSNSGLGSYNYFELGKFLGDKTAAIYPYVNATSEGFWGSTIQKDFEVFMQLLHLSFTQPLSTPEGYASYVSRRKTFIQNGENDPNTVFDNRLNEILNKANPWEENLKVKHLERIDADRCLDLYKDRFADPGNFTFIFVGNVDEEKLKLFSEKYIGSMPSEAREETWRDRSSEPHTGVVEEVVKKGMEPKGQVRLVFEGVHLEKKHSPQAIKALEKALSIRLREALREEKGGTYGVRVIATTKQVPNPVYTFTIGFGCAPENVDELVKATFDEIDKLKKRGALTSDLEKYKEATLSKREVDLKENRFWLNAIYQYHFKGGDKADMAGFEKRVRSVKPKQVKKAARYILDTENYLKLVLMPEN